ncbi:MAG: TolC family protein [Balneola sp.]
MGKRLGLLLIAAFLIAMSSKAQTSYSDKEITLEQAIEMALANNPQINRAILAIDDADQLVNIARSEVYPDITSSINYTRNVELPVQFIPENVFDPNGDPNVLVPVSFGTDNNWQGGFTVTQNLFKGEAIVALKSSAVFRKVQEENYRATSQQIITQTRIAYYAVLAAQEQLRLQDAQIRRLETNLKENEVRADAGIVDDYAVLRLRVQLSNQKPQQIEAKYAVDEAYRNLNIAMGLPVTFSYKVKGSLNEYDIFSETAGESSNSHLKIIDRMNPYNFSNTTIDSLSLTENRGDIRIADANLRLQDKQIRAEKSRFLPTLTASYNLQWSAAEAGSPDFFQDAKRFQTLGVNLSFPLFQGFSRMANLERAQIQYKDIEEQKRMVILMAQNEVASASEEIDKIFETASARKQALEQANIGYDRAKKRLENGLGSQLELTEAEIQVREAEVNYAIMVFNYLTAKANYDLATGMVPFVDTTN